LRGTKQPHQGDLLARPACTAAACGGGTQEKRSLRAGHFLNVVLTPTPNKWGWQERFSRAGVKNFGYGVLTFFWFFGAEFRVERRQAPSSGCA